jgi:hypothetical protein
VAGIGPQPDGMGGAVAARQGRAVGQGQSGRERLTSRTGRCLGLVGSGWVWEGVRGSGAARRGVLTGGPGRTVPPSSVLSRIKNIPNGFKILQTLTDPKGASPCSKYWK